MNSSQLFERAKKVAPGGVHSPIRSLQSLGRDPVFFKKAEGPYMWSVEGQKYIDYCQSWGPLVLGHRDPDVEAQVHEMIATAWSFGACEPYSLELGEWITGQLPFVEKLRFVSSGTEAVMSALRVARAATKRNKIVKFEGCYHGCVDSLLVQTGSGLAGTASSSSAGLPAEVLGSTLVAPLDNEEVFEQIMNREGENIAAVIIEPLPANYGLIIQRPEFLRKVAEVTKRFGAILVFDEVISGFRMALGGMAELTGIRPDLVTYGKVIGGGFPVGCYGGRRDLMDMVAPNGPVYQAGTLSANPVGMRAGLCTLQKMVKENGWQKLDQKGQYLEKNLKPMMEKQGIEFVRQGSLFWFHLKTEKPIRQIQQIPAAQKEFFKGLFDKMLAQGIYLAPHAFEVGFLSLAHTQEVLDQTIEAVTQALQGKA
jgi:glutamate-1-semialdehyde 2,1-aminomutase